jgi:hypothetical protein
MNSMSNHEYGKLIGVLKSSDMKMLPRLELIGEAIGKRKDSTDKRVDFMKFFLLDHQLIGISELIRIVSSQFNERDIEASFEKIKSDMLLMHNSDNVQTEFHDYHNHDMLFLAESSKSSYQEISTLTFDLGLDIYANKVNGFLKTMVDVGIEFMSKSPLTPMQKNGVDEIDKGLTSEFTNNVALASGDDYASEVSYVRK